MGKSSSPLGEKLVSEANTKKGMVGPSLRFPVLCATLWATPFFLLPVLWGFPPPAHHFGLNILAGELARSAKRAGNEALLKVRERSERLILIHPSPTFQSYQQVSRFCLFDFKYMQGYLDMGGADVTYFLPKSGADVTYKSGADVEGITFQTLPLIPFLWITFQTFPFVHFLAKPKKARSYTRGGSLPSSHVSKSSLQA
jgi:hypothetical protein